MVITLTNENFDEEINGASPLLIDFYSDKCAPCKLLADVLEEISGEYAGILITGKVDIEKNRALWAEYGIKSLPTVLIIKDGTVIDRVIGAVSKTELINRIDSALSINQIKGV